MIVDGADVVSLELDDTAACKLVVVLFCDAGSVVVALGACCVCVAVASSDVMLSMIWDPIVEVSVCIVLGIANKNVACGGFTGGGGGSGWGCCGSD